MDPYMDLTWVVYMQMCSQLIQNVTISLDLCTNVSGGLWEAAKEFRGRFAMAATGSGSGSGKGNLFSEGAPLGQRGKPLGSQRGASAGPPCGHLDGTLIILLLEPSSELAISIWRGAAGAQLWKASCVAYGAHLLIKAGLRPN